MKKIDWLTRIILVSLAIFIILMGSAIVWGAQAEAEEHSRWFKDFTTEHQNVWIFKDDIDGRIELEMRFRDIGGFSVKGTLMLGEDFPSIIEKMYQYLLRQHTNQYFEEAWA